MSTDAGNLTRVQIASEPVVEPVAPAVDVKDTSTGITVTPAEKPTEEAKLLAGKFKDAAALEAGYLELQKKMGEPKPVEPVVVPPVDNTPAQTAFMTAVGAAAVKVFGAEAEVETTLDWARQNLPEADKAMFDAALDSGNVSLVETALGTIRGKYVAAMGSQGIRVTGEQLPVETGAAGYPSRAAMLAVVRSREYKKGDARVHAEHARRMNATQFGVANGGI